MPRTEQLERRQILGAPLALTSEGLVLASPAADELLEPAVFAEAAPAAAAGAETPALAPEDDPLSPVGDPAAGTVADGSTSSSSCCCNPPITYLVSLIAVQDVSEATPQDQGYFRFTAQASCTAGAASSISVPISKASSTAEAPADYGGEIAANSVTIQLENGYGSKDASFIAKDEDLDEAPLETVRVEINETAIIIPNPAFSVATGTVFSGDFTFNKVFEGAPGGGHDEASASPTQIGEWLTAVGVDDVGWPKTERSIGIQVYDNGNPVVGRQVTLARTGSTEGCIVKVVDGAGADQDEMKERTDASGVAYFTIRYKQGDAGDDAQKFEAWVFNDEGNKDETFVTVRVVN
jgi:hypothetical protein